VVLGCGFYVKRFGILLLTVPVFTIPVYIKRFGIFTWFVVWMPLPDVEENPNE
jgi:hypothetical protein